MKEEIYVKGAKENNLKNIDVHIRGFRVAENLLLHSIPYLPKGKGVISRVCRPMPDSF